MTTAEEQTTVRDCQNTGLVDSRTTTLLTIGTQLTACNHPVRLSQKHSQSRDDVGRRTRNWWVCSTRHISLALQDELCVYLGRCGDRLLGTTMLWWATMDSLVTTMDSYTRGYYWAGLSKYHIPSGFNWWIRVEIWIGKLYLCEHETSLREHFMTRELESVTKTLLEQRGNHSQRSRTQKQTS